MNGFSRQEYARRFIADTLSLRPSKEIEVPDGRPTTIEGRLVQYKRLEEGIETAYTLFVYGTTLGNEDVESLRRAVNNSIENRKIPIVIFVNGQYPTGKFQGESLEQLKVPAGKYNPRKLYALSPIELYILEETSKLNVFDLENAKFYEMGAHKVRGVIMPVIPLKRKLYSVRELDIVKTIEAFDVKKTIKPFGEIVENYKEKIKRYLDYRDIEDRVDRVLTQRQRGLLHMYYEKGEEANLTGTELQELGLWVA